MSAENWTLADAQRICAALGFAEVASASFENAKTAGAVADGVAGARRRVRPCAGAECGNPVVGVACRSGAPADAADRARAMASIDAWGPGAAARARAAAAAFGGGAASSSSEAFAAAFAPDALAAAYDARVEKILRRDEARFG